MSRVERGRCGPLRVLSGRSSRHCAGALSSPSVEGGATPSSPAPSSVQRARARRLVEFDAVRADLLRHHLDRRQPRQTSLRRLDGGSVVDVPHEIGRNSDPRRVRLRGLSKTNKVVGRHGGGRKYARGAFSMAAYGFGDNAPLRLRASPTRQAPYWTARWARSTDGGLWKVYLPHLSFGEESNPANMAAGHVNTVSLKSWEHWAAVRGWSGTLKLTERDGYLSNGPTTEICAGDLG